MSNRGMLNKSYYREKMSDSKTRFSDLKKFISRSVFGELQLTHISLNFQTSFCNLKIRGLGAKLCDFSIIGPLASAGREGLPVCPSIFP